MWACEPASLPDVSNNPAMLRTEAARLLCYSAFWQSYKCEGDAYNVII